MTHIPASGARIAVLGAGAWGTAIAAVLSARGAPRQSGPSARTFHSSQPGASRPMMSAQAVP